MVRSSLLRHSDAPVSAGLPVGRSRRAPRAPAAAACPPYPCLKAARTGGSHVRVPGGGPPLAHRTTATAVNNLPVRAPARVLVPPVRAVTGLLAPIMPGSPPRSLARAADGTVNRSGRTTGPGPGRAADRAAGGRVLDVTDVCFTPAAVAGAYLPAGRGGRHLPGNLPLAAARAGSGVPAGLGGRPTLASSPSQAELTDLPPPLTILTYADQVIVGLQVAAPCVRVLTGRPAEHPNGQVT
ncbi:hypothetical protein [Streptomyces sp. NPDC021356]|uniref:hypothetical protein n=1 Tax=Streptomyces sp. NPDC021356 TaxID=3154900 RepID=UPI003408869E